MEPAWRCVLSPTGCVGVRPPACSCAGPAACSLCLCLLKACSQLLRAVSVPEVEALGELYDKLISNSEYQVGINSGEDAR